MVKALKRFLFGEEEQKTIQDRDESKSFIHTIPLGSYGTDINAGYPSEEYLATLRTQDRADVFDKMRRSDSQVIMLLSAVKNPIKSATRTIEPVDDSPDETKIADLIRHMLFCDMDQPFDAFLGEALTVCEFGHSVFENVKKIVLNDEKFGNYIGLKALLFRSPRTIERWNVWQDTGALKSISQYAYGDLQRLVDIPAEHLLIFTMNKEGASYEGISMLRPCYGNWFRKNEYLKLNAAGIEKFAIPTPLVEVPSGQYGGESYNYLIEALDVYCSHQANYLTHPEGWKIDLKTNAYDPQKVETSIDNEDKRMTKAFLANFLELGMNGTGAYALSNDLSDFFLGGIQHIADLISSTINKQLIPELVQLNFGPRAKYPCLKFSGITDKAGKEFADILSELSRTKIITPDDKLEEHVRDRYSIPKMSLLGQRKVDSGGGLFSASENPILNRIRASEARSRGEIKGA